MYIGTNLLLKVHILLFMAPHSSALAWKIPWTEELGRLQSMGSLRVRHTERLHFHFSLWCIGEGNGNPLQCSCLENPRDGGAWWAAVCGVAQSQTRLKQLWSSSCCLSQLPPSSWPAPIPSSAIPFAASLEFPRTTAANHHRFIPSQVWRLEVHGGTMLTSESCREELLITSSSLGACQQPLVFLGL